MYIPSSHLPRFVGDLQKRQTDPSAKSDSLIPHVDNKVGLMVGVGLAVAAILALLLGGLIKRYFLRRSKSKSESSPGETQTVNRRPSVSPGRPSNAGSESTLCPDSPITLQKELSDHVPRPLSVLAASQTLVPPYGSRPSSALSIATTTSQCTVQTEHSKRWGSIAQRLDEKADARDARHMSTSSTLPTTSSVPPSPRTPTSPSSPISTPSPASLKDNKRHIYGSD